MSLKIGIIGGGIYGSHIAQSLNYLGFEVKLFEQHQRLFHEASGNNQFRLHQGFHYARHARTRTQSREGFSRFIERYPTLSEEVTENIYAVPKLDSAIDFNTYRIIMSSTGVNFTEVESCSTPILNVEGLIKTNERVVMIEKSRAFFTKELGKILHLDTKVEKIKEFSSHVELNGEKFDYLIDATWGHFRRPKIDIFFEPTILLYFEGPKDFPAITLVDGPLGSIYPTEERGIYTLSSVPHSPLGQFKLAEEAVAVKNAISRSLVSEKTMLMVNQIQHYVPSFKDEFKYLGPQFAIKSKPTGANDDRSCYVEKVGRVFSVLSGKIDNIFFAMEHIISILEAATTDSANDVNSMLRRDIEIAKARLDSTNNRENSCLQP